MKGSDVLNKKIFALILAFVIVFTLTIPISAGQTLYQLVMSQDTFFVNGKLFNSGDLPILNYRGVNYVPLRKLSEALGIETEYDPVTKAINIVTKADITKTETVKVEKSVEEIAENVKSTVFIAMYSDIGETYIGSGSGVVVGGGLIVTNYHVIDDAVRYGISYNNTPDNQEYGRSGFIAFEMFRDIAVIPSPNELIQAAKLGDSSNLKLGQKVVAIGSPKGLKNTVSEGIISGFRNIDGYDFIQTTAPISPGSSGGGLYNMQGELIGITSLKQVDGESLNFAIPINDVKRILNDNNTLLNRELYNCLSTYWYIDSAYWFNSLCFPDGTQYHVNYYLFNEHEGADRFLANYKDVTFRESFSIKLDEIHAKLINAGYTNYILNVNVKNKSLEMQYKDNELVTIRNTLFDNP